MAKHAQKRSWIMQKSSALKNEWLVPALLTLLALLPVFSGVARVLELGTSTTITPENQRFFAAPLPIIAHSLGGIVFLILGAFQFAPRLRRPKPGWHKMAGRLLIPSGLVVAFSGIWMAQFNALPEYDGVLVYATRMLSSVWMILTIVLGTTAIYRRDFTNHAVWMTRAYAIGAGGGTQVLTAAPLLLFFPQYLNDPNRAIGLGAGWLMNVIVAEWAIRRMRVKPNQTAAYPQAKVNTQIKKGRL
jgi:uncharacterized membrane protein